LLGINKHKHKNKIKTCGEVYADSAYTNKKNDEKLSQQNNKVLHRAYRNTPLTDRGVDMHFIAIGGFSFTISDYFDIIASFRILSVVAIPTLAFA
jgi:hypothetical protein